MKAEFRSIYNPLEGGVWVLQNQSGLQYVPVNMPSVLKVPHLKSSCLITVLPDVTSVFQVGEHVRIISYKILG